MTVPVPRGVVLLLLDHERVRATRSGHAFGGTAANGLSFLANCCSTSRGDQSDGG